MSVAKVIEISAESPKSFEDAIQSGIARASKTIHGTKSVWVKEQHLVGLRIYRRGVHREDLSL